MPQCKLLMLGILLLAYSGCGKTEDKTEPAKTEPVQTETRKTEPDQTEPSPQVAQNNVAQNNPSQPKTTPRGSANAAETKGFSLVPQGAAALISVRPSAALASPFVKSFPNQDEIHQAMAMMRQNVGFDANNIARVTVALWPGNGNVFPGIMDVLVPQAPPREPAQEEFPEPAPDAKLDIEVETHPVAFQPGGPGGPSMMEQMIKSLLPKFDGAVFVEFHQPVDLNQLVTKLPEEAQVQTMMAEGVSLKVSPTIPIGGGMAAWQPNPNMLVVTFKDDVADIAKGSGPNELVTQALAEGENSSASFQLSLKPFQGLLTMASQFAQGAVKDGQNLPRQLKTLSLFVGLNEGADVNLLIDATDPQAVKNIKESVDQQYQAMADEVKTLPQGLQSSSNEELKSSYRELSQEVYQSVKSETQGNQYRLSLRVPGNAVALSQKIATEQRKGFVAINNLKQIGIAVHNYFDHRRQFPFPAGDQTAPEANRNKLSWRVHLLPYLEEAPLYEQFKLDEPWDSEHNKALLDKMPDIFKLSEDAKPGHTQIVVPAGKGYIVDGDNKRTFATISDGTSNTIMVLTVKPENAEPWTKPGGFELDPAKAAEILGGHPRGFLAGFVDGSVQVIGGDLDAETLKGLLTISGGDVVDRSSLK